MKIPKRIAKKSEDIGQSQVEKKFLSLRKETGQLSIQSRKGRQSTTEACCQNHIKLLVFYMIIKISNEKST